MIDQQEDLISSFKDQPLIVVLRPKESDFLSSKSDSPLVSLIEELNLIGVRNIEIAWSSNPRWILLVQELIQRFKKINFGAASINKLTELQSLQQLKIKFAMAPIWDDQLILHSQSNNQILIPGVLSPTEIHKASQFGCKIIKVFPASIVGINYIKQLKEPINSIPFTIAAGGIKCEDLNKWIESGYDAIALGRGLMDGGEISPKLINWISQYNK